MTRRRRGRRLGPGPVLERRPGGPAAEEVRWRVAFLVRARVVDALDELLWDGLWRKGAAVVRAAVLEVCRAEDDAEVRAGPAGPPR